MSYYQLFRPQSVETCSIPTSPLQPLLRLSESCLLTLDRSHHLARVPTSPELHVVDPLPSARVQAAVGNRHSDRRADER